MHLHIWIQTYAHMYTCIHTCTHRVALVFAHVNSVKIGFVTLDRKALYPHINAVSESIVSTYFVICYSQP